MDTELGAKNMQIFQLYKTGEIDLEGYRQLTCHNHLQSRYYKPLPKHMLQHRVRMRGPVYWLQMAYTGGQGTT